MVDNKNELNVIKTDDGSYTLYNALLDETYHSTHGALQESEHVFINNGFNLMPGNRINILEAGLGTGLNAALTALASAHQGKKTFYTALEPYPIKSSTGEALLKGFQPELGKLMMLLTQSPPDFSITLNHNFQFIWHLSSIQTFNSDIKYDLIYFDAFAPLKQPDMWTAGIFKKLFEMLNPGGLLTTYCAKGVVKRILKSQGFVVKSCKGPPGKREMTLAFKTG